MGIFHERPRLVFVPIPSVSRAVPRASGRLTLALVLSSTPVWAQQQVQAVPVLGPVRDAGIYHVATGTWTRNAPSTANLGPDIIYRNDHPSGYFGTGWEGATAVDEGVLPTTSSPHLGPQDDYEISGLSFSYCAFGAGPTIQWDLTLFDSYVTCDDPDNPANCIHEAGFMSLTNLPTASSCWLVTVDLTGGSEVCMAGDGGPCAPGYDGQNLGLDTFGFGQKWLNGGVTAGPVLSGNSNWAPAGEGTCYNPTLSCSAGGTGLGLVDLFGLGDPLNGCFWFGGSGNSDGCGLVAKFPHAQFDLVLFTDCTQTCDPHCPELVFCDEAQDPDNFADIGIDTCDCGAGSINVSMSNGPANSFLYLLASESTALIANPPGAMGTLCLGSPQARYIKDVGITDAGGNFSTDVLNAVTGGGGGQVPGLGKNLCTPGGGTWYFQYWHRGVAGQLASFSSTLQATIQ